MDAQTARRYQGCLATPPLWRSETVSPFRQIDLIGNPAIIEGAPPFSIQRLGKLVEAFLFHQLKNQADITWIVDNLQIQENKRTVGEIDALYFAGDTPIHLEVAYKFYLYDTRENYAEPLAYWIGPNRKDNLFYKLAKLQGRQFPLLHKPSTKAYLDTYQLEASQIKQQLCFKAQLFLPYQGPAIDLGPINQDCVAGFYIASRQLPLFSAYSFYVPAKLDWLVAPHHQVNWLGYATATAVIEAHLADKRAPLVWFKRPDGVLEKGFVVFW